MIRRAVAMICLSALLPATSGCFGAFALTRKVYEFNRRIDDDKWIQWVTFVVLNFVPVYGAATFIDAVFANSVEFWSGQNPILAASTRTETGPNGETVRATFLPGRVCELEVIDALGQRHFIRLVAETDRIAVFDEAGQLLGRVGDFAGEPVLLAAGD